MSPTNVKSKEGGSQTGGTRRVGPFELIHTQTRFILEQFNSRVFVPLETSKFRDLSLRD
jgi:hypothetical protein